MKEINSSSNQQFKLFKKLLSGKKYRLKEGSYLAEGLNMLDIPAQEVLAYLVSGQFSHLIAEKNLAENKVILLEHSLFKELSADPATQGLMVWAKMPDHSFQPQNWEDEPTAVYLAVEDIQDPGNLGTILRTAEAAGAKAVFCSPNTVDIYHPKVIKSAASSLSRIWIYTDVEMPELLETAHRKGIATFATSPVQAMSYDQVSYVEGALFLIGNEGNGLKAETIEMAQNRIYIRMEGQIESLNAAISAAIVLYEAKRQRDNKASK